MDSLRFFLKENKVKRENAFFGASSSLKDENGEVVLWEIRPISTKEDEMIREECICEARGRGVRIDYGSYMKKMAVASVVFPPLYNAELQDSYGVKSPEDLLEALIDSPGEYQEFIKFVQKENGFDVTMAERIGRAKN